MFPKPSTTKRVKTMQWEHKVIALPQALSMAQEVLAEAGAQGWELVNVFAYHAFFKRPKA